MPPAKRTRADEAKTADDEDPRDELIRSLQAQIMALQDAASMYYASSDAVLPQLIHSKIPEHGLAARHVKEVIVLQQDLDNKPRLNTSSYVNVVREPEECDVALMGLSINLADASIYPASVRIHDTVVNMVAQLWNCPPPTDRENYSGAGTVGSTEACLLAGLALKFRWREWYRQKHDLDVEQAMGVVPNLIISSCFQAAWEKFFRYFDVTPRFVKPTLENKMRMDPSKIEALCDERTLGVVGILGNHYNGAYDPIYEINNVVEEINKKNGFQIAIHVDGASGGFVAPFQDSMPPFDFRLKNVLSMSASGHKFGESACGTGWLVFRHHEDLAEHIAVAVTYLGGKSDSMTLNFSRPATAAYSQFYKLLRLGMSGYKQKVSQQMQVTKYMRDFVKQAKVNGKPRFEVLDAGDEHCLPVLAARLNPVLHSHYNDIGLQHAISEFHWYVSGYALSFDDFTKGGQVEALCSDTTATATMFRVVVKSNLTLGLAQDLMQRLDDVLKILDQEKGHYRSLKAAVLKVKSITALSKGHAAC